MEQIARDFRLAFRGPLGAVLATAHARRCRGRGPHGAAGRVAFGCGYRTGDISWTRAVLEPVRLDSGDRTSLERRDDMWCLGRSDEASAVGIRCMGTSPGLALPRASSEVSVIGQRLDAAYPLGRDRRREWSIRGHAAAPADSEPINTTAGVIMRESAFF